MSVKIDINYTKCYPSIIEPIKMVGLYEKLLERKGAFIDHFYNNVNTKTLSYVYFKFDVINNEEELTFNYNRWEINSKMFWVNKDSYLQITSNSYLPILKVINSFMRDIKINSILN